MTPRPELRISDAEREAAVSALGEHYAAGRLTKDEYDERADRAWAARTASALAPLFADLPPLQPPGARPAGPAARPAPVASGRGRGRGVPFVPVLLLVLGLAMLVRVPWPFLLLAGWLLWRGFFLRGFAGRWSHPGWRYRRW